MSLTSTTRAQQQAAQPTPPGIAVTVEVIGSTPLPGIDLPLEDIPAPVQTAISRDLENSGALDLSDFMNRRLNGVHVNEIQGNPFQADVNYRGYTASPLLGTPQGVSVYLDGVRLNQPFGDVVSWDLIPRAAIASTTLMPGSNPLFGLNTLGGALAVQTKDGRTNPGSSLQATYGSHARRALEFESGAGGTSGLSWYFAGTLFRDDGWRQASPSDVRQIFSKLGWKSETTNVALTMAHADNSLTGNGLQDQRLLDRSYASVYTTPDTTDNQSTFVNLTGTHATTATRSLSWNAYYRDLRTSTVNGDINDGSLDEAVYQPSAADRAALAAAGYTGVPAIVTPANTPFPTWRCIAQALQRDEPAEKCDGVINRGSTTQHNYGGSAQWTMIGGSARRVNRFTFGTAYDASHLDFTQSSELGYLNPDRSVAGISAFGDGVTGGTFNGVPYDTRVDLDGTVNTFSAYATDALSIGGVHVTISGRYNRTNLANRDRLRPGGGLASLDGDYVFARFNPAAGVTWSPSRAVNLYAGYSEGSRSPTSIELGCANPTQPCKLPNAMAGDPPLDQVVTWSWDAGVRGGVSRGSHLSWTLGGFGATNSQDILFVASTQTGAGYFKNFGSTSRRGVEADVRARLPGVTLGSGYTFLDATYQSAETIDGSSNSANSAAQDGVKGLDGTMQIAPGDRIPLIPRHVFKAFVDVEFAPALSFDLDLVAVSGSLARGNENNQHQPDGVYYLGDGTVAGYATVNGGAHYRLTRAFQLVGQVNNIFDRRYATAAQLGATGLTSEGSFIARPFPTINGEFPVQHATFVAPGAPRAFWLGLRMTF